ncbi:MAG: hypothetical protein R3345_02270 [Fulvivirga sp.]|nr:hypothetical protein [Fulvivirga sp.]
MWRVFLILLMAVPIGLFAQSVEELEKRNGFKDIKLISSPHSYEGLELKKEGVDDETFPNTRIYEAKKGHYERIGKIKIHDLEVYAYKDSIYKIVVVTEKDPKLYQGMKKLFGEPEYAYGSDRYYWMTDKLRLSYGSHGRNKIEMTYFSYLMVEKRKQEKEEVIEDIADDF